MPASGGRWAAEEGGISHGEALPEGSGEESGLSVEAGVCGVIPNEVISLGDLRCEVQLSGEDLVGDSGGNLAVTQEARALGGRRAGYDDDRCKLRLGAGFIQERNIHAEPTVISGRRTRTGRPGLPDRGVEDLFKFTAFRDPEDSFTQPDAIGPACGVKGS